MMGGRPARPVATTKAELNKNGWFVKAKVLNEK
jgi:hypothetical protein